MLVLGHLGFALLGGRLLRGLVATDARFPVGFLLAGALLPDLIDKPLGHFLLAWNNGRLFGHTLLFLAGLTAAAWALASQRLGALALGTSLHHLLDQLPWRDPATSLWPLAGGFPRGVSSGAPDWIHMLLHDPFVWTTEAAGLALLLALGAWAHLRAEPAWWEAGAGPTEPIEAAAEPAGSPP